MFAVWGAADGDGVFATFSLFVSSFFRRNPACVGERGRIFLFFLIFEVFSACQFL